jgi:WD40 repeat protein
VRIWNAASGIQELELRGHTKWVNSVGFSPDGKHIVSGSDDKMVRIWKVESGVTVGQYDLEAELKGHTGWVMSVAYSPDGKHIVSGSDDKTVRIWNVEQTCLDPQNIDLGTT